MHCATQRNAMPTRIDAFHPSTCPAGDGYEECTFSFRCLRLFLFVHHQDIYLYPIFTFDVVSEVGKRVSDLSDLSFLRIPNRSNLARGVKAKAAGCIMY